MSVRVLETLQVPVPRSISAAHVTAFPAGSRARARTANTPALAPCLAARAHVSASQGQLCSCAYRRHSRCPCSAARVHVSASQGQLCSCAHRRHSRCPPLAAKQQTTPFSTRHDSQIPSSRASMPPPRAQSTRESTSSLGSRSSRRTSGGRDPKNGPSPWWPSSRGGRLSSVDPGWLRKFSPPAGCVILRRAKE